MITIVITTMILDNNYIIVPERLTNEIEYYQN